MSKNAKTNKLERKNLMRKRTSNFRSINAFQIIDKIPNDNLYKNDNLYTINKHLEFSPNEEQSFRLFCHYHYQNYGIKGVLMLVYCRFISSRINKFTDLFSFFKIFNMKNLFHLISFFISYILSKNIFLKQEYFNIILYYLFSFNQFLHIYSIYFEISPDLEMHLAIPSEIMFNLFLLFFLNARIKHTFFPIIMICILYIYSSKVYSGLNIIFFVPLGIAMTTLLYLLLLKSIREIWALFDSFKRSYYNMNQGLLDSDPNPIFIISRDRNILYRNTAAIQLSNNILEVQNTQKKLKRNQDDRFNTLNFLDIIHPNLRDLFIKLLNDVMADEQVSSFNFPLCKKNTQQNPNIDVSNAYDINDDKNYLNFIWFSVLVCKTEWKSKTAYYMYLFVSDDILCNEIFYQYTKRFSEKIENVISTSDIINSAFLTKISQKNKSSSSMGSIKKNENGEGSNTNILKKNELTSPKKNIYKLLIDNEDNIELNNTILYFFKNQVELLYDYSLTLEIYFTMLYRERNFKFIFNNKKKIEKKKIKLNELKSYYSEYFYDFTREHQYKLEFKNDEEKNLYDIHIEENYLRMILFNVIVFMICYLDDKTDQTNDRKEIVIRLIPELKEELSKSPLTPDSNQKEYSDSERFYKKGELSIILQSFSLKVDLNKVQELLEKNKNNYRIKAEIIKLNYLDIGLLTVKYLLENYYKTNLLLSSEEGEQIIQFKLPCDLELSTDNYNKANNTNLSPGSNSFFTSPLIHSRGIININKNINDINKPKNFYNYNQDYNKKVLNIFYGIEKSPEIRSRHRRGMPSFSVLNEEKNRGRRYLRNISQNFVKFSNGNIPIYHDFSKNESNKGQEQENNNKKSSKNNLNKFSLKLIDLSFNSEEGSKSDKEIIEEELDINIKNEDETKNPELEQKEKEKEKENMKNEVLIITNQNNNDLISFLNNENKGDYILKVIKDISEAEKELKNNDGNCLYKVLLINMGNNKEIKFAENVCENKGDSLIFGYHFGANTKSKEKNNVKFDKRFDLSFSYEGILYALNHVFISNTSIIK